MLKVMIVDDEILARVGIRSLIPWEENGFEIVAECDNGRAAFEEAGNCHPDIILTDIKMPLMNGIELISALKDSGIRFVVLSSHDDFDLVREAMKAGAEDYILKLQMEPGQLLDVLHQLKESINKERRTALPERVNHSVEKGSPEEFLKLRERFCRDLINGKTYSDREIEEYIRLYGLNFTPRSPLVFLLRLDSGLPAGGDELFWSSLQGILTQNIAHFLKGQLFKTAENLYAVLCTLETDEEEAAVLLRRMAESVRDIVKNTMNVSLSIAVGNAYEGYRHIRQSYLEALEALERIAGGMKERILFYQDMDDKNTGLNSSIPGQLMEKMAQSLKTGNQSEIREAFADLNAQLGSIGPSTDKDLAGQCQIIRYLVNEFMRDNHIPGEAVWGDRECWDMKLNALRGVREFQSWVEEVRDRILALGNWSGEGSSVILRARSYVSRNLSSPISLASVSRELNLSPAYFSRLFSTETGQGFIDYVTEEKMNLACELIRGSGKKIYEVAEAVGYDNVHYFSRVFKKTTGMTPLEYRKGKR